MCWRLSQLLPSLDPFTILQLCFCFWRFIIVFVCVFLVWQAMVCCVCFVNWSENAAVIYEPHLSSTLITPVLLSPLSEYTRLYSRHKAIVRAGSVVTVICTRLPCGLLPSVCLPSHVPLPPSRSLWQIYCFMTSWNWTLVLLKPMSRNKINSFSRISCSFCAYNTDNAWIVNHILKNSERWWSEQEILEKIQTWH